MTSIDLILKLAEYLSDAASRRVDIYALAYELQDKCPPKLLEACWQAERGNTYTSHEHVLEAVLVLLDSLEFTMSKPQAVANALSENIGNSKGQYYTSVIAEYCKLYSDTSKYVAFTKSLMAGAEHEPASLDKA